MNARDWLNGIDESWGCWFAGFVDGEGCFSIHAGRCAFAIKLRADDRPLLDAIQTRLGFGGIYKSRHYGPDNPQFAFQVHRQRDVLLLCDLFERYRLQSKKARDFAIWSRAADLRAVGDADGVTAAWKELRDIRQYRELVA